MRLSLKTFIIIAVTVGVGLVGIFGVAGTVLVTDYKDLEQAGAEQDMARMVDAVGDDLAALEWNTRQATDLAGVLFTGDPAGVADNQTIQLFYSLFLESGIDAGFVIGPDDNVSFGFTFDITNFTFVAPPAALNASIAGHPVLDRPGPAHATSGLHAADGTVYLLASYGLDLPEGLVPSAGPNVPLTVVLARAVDAEYQEALAARLQEDVRLYASPGPDVPSGLAAAPAGGLVLQRHDWDRMTLWSHMDGFDGEPALVIAMDQERAAFAQGIDSMTFFFVASLVISGALLAAGMLVIRFAVTNRVRRLSQHMQEIQATGSRGARVDVGGADEVTDLSDGFNDLMAALEQRTQELESNAEELARSNEDLQSFARVVTHDLKSPLSTFALNLHLIRTQAEASGDEAEVARIDRMTRTVAKMSERIETILAYSRGRQAEDAMGAVDLNAVLDDVLEDLAAEVQTSGAKILRKRLPVVQGDGAQLAQVLQNLLSNALKYTRNGEPPRVRIWADPGRTGWAVHVEDQGRGFLPENAEQMFKPFERLPGAADTEGHGVGLATCARIMDRHGGRLHAQGVLGKGARFTMLLHAPQAEAE